MIDRIDPTIVLALAVALLGVIPAAWIWASQPADQSSVAPTVPAPMTVEAPPQIDTGVDAAAPIVVEELDPSVSAVLQERGFLGRVDSIEPALANLDPDVIALLKAHEVVLQVAEPEVAP